MEYNISNKFRRFNEGISKWRENNYKGLFQYTEKLNIPSFVECVLEHIKLKEQVIYNIIIVPDNNIKSALNDFMVLYNSEILTIDKFIKFIKQSTKNNDKFYCTSIICLDCTNNLYHDNNSFWEAFRLVETKFELFITSKRIKDKASINFNKFDIKVIDVITKETAEVNGWLPNYVIYNVGLDFDYEEKRVYTDLTENINNTIRIFKNKAERINYLFKQETGLSIELVDNDFDLIKACKLGKQYTANITEKPVHVHSEVIRNMLASIMGWSKDLDLSNDYNKQLDMYWNPDNILSRVESYLNSVDKRISLYGNNKSKRSAVDYIISKIKSKAIILSNDNDFIEYVGSKENCMPYYKNIPSRSLLDDEGNPYTYKKGMKKGENKVFGEIGILKEAIRKYSEDKINVIATKEIANSEFDLQGLEYIICTYPHAKPFETINDNKIFVPYINKAKVIIWLYMKDFEVNNEDFKESKDKTKLIDMQKNITTDIIWLNDVESIKFD